VLLPLNGTNPLQIFLGTGLELFFVQGIGTLVLPVQYFGTVIEISST
jgi:hypothetical protein